jgi:hypothetical protein
VEGSLCLALDLVNSDTVCDLDKGKAVGEVDIEDTLGRELVYYQQRT